MKKRLHIQRFTFLVILILGAACNGTELPKEKEALKHATNISDPHFGAVRCSLKDREGNLWFGTMGKGLYKYDGKSFTQFTMKEGLDCLRIYCLLEDSEGKLWIGTEKGLCLYNGQTFDKIRIPLPQNLPPNKNAYYQSHWVYSMVQAKNGKIWFATIDGVYVYDGKSFTHFPMKEAANGFLTDNDKIERLLEDNVGNIWLGGRTNEGVFRYDGQSITHVKLPELIQGHNGPRPKPHRWGWPQLQDKNGNLWFSNWGGVYRYDGKSVTGFSAKEGLAVTMIARVIEDKRGNIWLSGDRLFRYDGKSIIPYPTRNGLGGWSILEDAIGNLWVSTKDKGLYIFDGTAFMPYSEYINSQETANEHNSVTVKSE